MLSDINIMVDVREGTQAEHTSNTIKNLYTIQYSYTARQRVKF